MADQQTTKVIALATARLSPKERARIEHEQRELAAGKVKIETRHDALVWGDGWEAYAKRLEAQVERLQMLHMIAEIHAQASDLLYADALNELERMKGLI